MILSASDRIRLNNISHCYDKYSIEPSVSVYSATLKFLLLRLHQFINCNKPVFVHFVSYLKHLPEVQSLDVDDQVLLIAVLFFTTNSLATKSIYDPGQYQQLNNITEIQTSYIELLRLYMLEKCDEENAIHLWTRMITKYLNLQIIYDHLDSIIQMNIDIEHIDALMQTLLHLT
jgi:hypothetical protein